jgi:hypothetical protein
MLESSCIIVQSESGHVSHNCHILITQKWQTASTKITSIKHTAEQNFISNAAPTLFFGSQVVRSLLHYRWHNPHTQYNYWHSVCTQNAKIPEQWFRSQITSEIFLSLAGVQVWYKVAVLAALCALCIGCKHLHCSVEVAVSSRPFDSKAVILIAENHPFPVISFAVIKMQ